MLWMLLLIGMDALAIGIIWLALAARRNVGADEDLDEVEAKRSRSGLALVIVGCVAMGIAVLV